MRQLQYFSDKFCCISDILSVLSTEFSDDISDEDTEYSIGFFEGRHQTKRWLVSDEDVAEMYKKFHQGEISLWCGGKEPEESQPKGKKRKQPEVV